MTTPHVVVTMSCTTSTFDHTSFVMCLCLRVCVSVCLYVRVYMCLCICVRLRFCDDLTTNSTKLSNPPLTHNSSGNPVRTDKRRLTPTGRSNIQQEERRKKSKPLNVEDDALIIEVRQNLPHASGCPKVKMLSRYYLQKCIKQKFK